MKFKVNNTFIYLLFFVFLTKYFSYDLPLCKKLQIDLRNIILLVRELLYYLKDNSGNILSMKYYFNKYNKINITICEIRKNINFFFYYS